MGSNVPITATQCIEQGWTLTIHCATCRVSRVGDLVDLAIRRPGRDIKTMKFKCATCGSPGTPSIAIMAPSYRQIWTR